ncbi:MAG: carboxypeptidase-like regulatory domain-containing protein [Oscillatoria sp. SIO1A7]|nr:carboxypeptidase-like regulatory domain-containing protein [Oscillatoria sp. SIO1A7]
MSGWMELQLRRHKVAIYGRVSDEETELAIHGAVVEMTSMPEAFENWLALHSLQYGRSWATMRERPDRKITSVDGYFYFVDLPNGDYTLRASLPKAGTRYGTAEVSATVSREIPDNINKTANIALPPTAIKGQIVDENGDPVGMAKVKIKGSSEYAFSDGDGNYFLSNLEASQNPETGRTAEAIVSARGYYTNSKTVELFKGQVVKEYDFTLLSADPEDYNYNLLS